MKTRSKIALCLLGSVGIMLSIPLMLPATANTTTQYDLDVKFATEINDEVNRVRISEFGLNGLVWSDALADNARLWSINMSNTGEFEHGGNYFNRDLSNHCAQNLFMSTGHESAHSVVQAWLDSPPHRASLLNPIYQYEGIGVFNGYVTENFC